jgi:hypothetical protein
MARDARRTVLILSDEVDLFAALRPQLDAAMVQVTWVTPDELPAAADDAVPWPWAIAGRGDKLPADAVRRLEGLPVLWYWLGNAPLAAPAGTRPHAKWRELLTDIQDCLARTVAGVRLAPNRGLVAPDQSLVLSAELEGLLGAAPSALKLSSRSALAAERAVNRYGLPLALQREGDAVGISARN